MQLIKRLLLRCLLVLFGIAAACSVLETGAWLLDTAGLVASRDAVTSTHLVEADARLGYRIPAASGYQGLKPRRDGSPCYRVAYRTDEYGRRTVGVPAGDSDHLLLFGCSLTYGEGLSDSDTLQAQLQQLLPERRIFNYANPGYGPAQTLAQLESGRLPREVSPSSGSALFFLGEFHAARAAGFASTSWLFDGPRYVLDARQGVVQRGTFRSSVPWRSLVLQGFDEVSKRSAFLRAVRLDYPLWIDEEHVELTARILVRAARLYESRFQGSFRVVLHPIWDPTSQARSLAVVRRVFEREKISVLDYSQLSFGAEQQIGGGCDPHPNAQFNQMLAKRLAQDVVLDDHSARLASDQQGSFPSIVNHSE